MLKNIRKTTQHKYKHQITPSNKKIRNPKYGTRIPRRMPTFLSAQTGAASELGVAFLYVIKRLCWQDSYTIATKDEIVRIFHVIYSCFLGLK